MTTRKSQGGSYDARLAAEAAKAKHGEVTVVVVLHNDWCAVFGVPPRPCNCEVSSNPYKPEKRR
jgi:hypothetical protein